MPKMSLLLFTWLLAIAVNGQTKSQKTILGIFAHPDDENMIGPVLAKYAREGYQVQVIIATDGKYSPKATNIPEGDSLGRIRRQETICACQALGILPPIYLGIDRLDTRNGVRPYLNGRKQFLKELQQHITRIDPDAIITFGPDGEYGHPEHIVVGAATTEILLREGWVDKYPLYFLGWKKEQVTDDEDLGYVDAQYLQVAVRYSDEDASRAIAAEKCYKSQKTAAEMEALKELLTSEKEKSIYFRKFTAPANQKMKNGFF
ncbi:PIG-L family deacetylase [Flavihumibacter rivuli]|uniref:PIG-L family deacetylase n=1 Tax=Flavihumibacter rivuli TaxID=2838156 RepID=UPI001BDED10B|nr:PIG-L family deacetylase [Flavihumibacter rivuli]ULQ57083.1 PIG-L family deacetylase [Flavihumibacter rivuli]